MTRSLPDDQLLTDYAAGALPAGLSLLVASHLTFSPESRRRVAQLERIGGALLDLHATDPLGDETFAGPAPTPPSLEAMMARLDREGPRAPAPAPAPERAAKPPAAAPGSPFPAPLRAAMDGLGLDGTGPEGVPWKKMLPGLSEYVIEGLGEPHEEVSLLRARPGAPIFGHTHTGVETTLVLCGQLQDRGRVYEAGEVSIADHDDDHRPRIVGEDICICLVVMTGEMRFTGRLTRVLNYLT